jgi:hypothetical protein
MSDTVCWLCDHPAHTGICGHLFTETIKDDVGWAGPPTGIERTQITHTCQCGTVARDFAPEFLEMVRDGYPGWKSIKMDGSEFIVGENPLYAWELRPDHPTLLPGYIHGVPTVVNLMKREQ